MNRATRLFIVLLLAESAFLVNTWASALVYNPSKQETKVSSSANQLVFTGIVKEINGNQWTINDQVYTVDPSVMQSGTLTIGDSVKVQANVAQDGSVKVTSISLPYNANAMTGVRTTTQTMASGLKSFANSVMAIAAPGSEDQNEAYENKTTGTLDAMDASSVTVGGKVYMLTSDSEVKNGLTIGMMVRLEYYAMPDGSFVVEELGPAKYNTNGNGNYNNNSNNNNNSCSNDEHDDEQWSNSNSNSNSNSSGFCHEDDGDD